MIRPKDAQMAKRLTAKLDSFTKKHPMPGIRSKAAANCLIEQLVDSVKRIKYIELILTQQTNPVTLNVTSNGFDPLKGAVWHKQSGNLDEAFWLVFLATHFGKNINTGWRLVRDVYGGLGNTPTWTWSHVSQAPGLFREWIEANQHTLRSQGHFGNHRKYENLSGVKPRGTGAAFVSYVNWVGEGHDSLVHHAISEVGDNPRELFDYLYNSMAVVSFGRTAKFDYLTMIGKMKLVDVEPGSVYLDGATGPLRGAKLLFGKHKKRKELDALLSELETHLGLNFGMQILEDSLCNWQKNPREYVHFRG